MPQQTLAKKETLSGQSLETLGSMERLNLRNALMMVTAKIMAEKYVLVEQPLYFLTFQEEVNLQSSRVQLIYPTKILRQMHPGAEILSTKIITLVILSQKRHIVEGLRQYSV